MAGSSSADRVVGLVTCPVGEARTIAAAIIAAHHAACVNIFPAVQSVYRWEGKTEFDEEALLVIKTTADRIADLDEQLKDIHPYDTFELVVLPIVGGSNAYLEWITASVR